jgi:ABC-2 type transport system ATP-binding protein
VAAVLDDDGVSYGALAWTQPDLEDVYLALTGTGVGGGGEPVEREAPVAGAASSGGTTTPRSGGEGR